MNELRQNSEARAAFRACLRRFRQCAAGGTSWGGNNEEYITNFYLVAHHTLAAGDWKLFCFHFLLGADAKACCRALVMESGQFNRAVSRIEAQLGCAFLGAVQSHPQASAASLTPESHATAQ